MSASVKFDDLCLAYEFVSSGGALNNAAYLSVETGEIYYDSDDLDEDLPEDIEDSDKYIAIPDKYDLDLGNRLALRFADDFLPEDAAEKVHYFFRRKGAYARFKDLLDSLGKLQEWFDYQEKATNDALQSWCERNGIKIDG